MLTPKRKGSDYHHGDLKSAAILAARNLIASGGISALGMRRVAQKIGVTPPALYRHFESIDDLLCEVSLSARQELAELMIKRRSAVVRRSDKRKSELDKFLAIGEAYLDFAEKHPRLFEVAFGSQSKKQLSDYNEQAWEILNESIESLVALGMTSKSKRETAPLMAWSAVHGLATLITNNAVAEGDLKFFRKAVMDGIQDSLIMK